MKRSLWFGLLLVSASAFAEPKYEYKTMECWGAIRRQPSGMHDSYRAIGIRFVNFLSTRRDGTKALSLAWHNFYAPTVGLVRERMSTQNGGSEVWYMGRLEVDTDRGVVFAPERHLASFDNKLELRITSRTPRLDTLKGVYVRQGTVVGGYTYDLNCRARK